MLRALDRLWLGAAITAAGLLFAFWAFTQQVDYLTFGVFVGPMVLLGWIVTRVRFLQRSRSPADFANWARAELEQGRSRMNMVSRINGALLVVGGLVGLSLMALFVQPWNVSRIAWFAGAVAWVVLGSWLFLAGRRN